MIRKISIVGLVGLILTVLTGCPDSWYDHFLITDINLSAAEINKKGAENGWNTYDPTMTFENSINFVLTFEKELIAFNSDFIAKSYATTRGTKYNNELVEETYKITFSKPFTYNGDTIYAGTNILEVQNILPEIDVFESYMTFNSTSADRVIEMSDTFLEKVRFDTTDYKVIFACRTTDEKILKDSVNVKFRIKK